MNTATWHDCYSNGWQEGELTSDAFSHPAKAARGLIYRIIRFGLQQGWFTGDTVLLDCFGGIGTTGLAASSFGIRSISVELEQKFVDIAQQNFALHAKERKLLGLPDPILVQGDSRQLGRIVREVGGALTSPPYIDEQTRGGDLQKRIARIAQAKDRGVAISARTQRLLNKGDANVGTVFGGEHYGATPGQLGAMREGSLGAVTSPPYEGSDPSASHSQGTSRKNPKSKNYRPVAERDWQERETPREYGATPGQIGAVTSPPYGNRVDDHGVDHAGYEGQSEALGRYGESDGQLGNLRIGGVTSPPYEGIAQKGGTRGLKEHGTGLTKGERFFTEYGSSEGQLGQTQGDTYWSAVAQVYHEVYGLLSPDGVFAVIVKGFVRNKQIIDLPAMTLSLLEDIGFTPLLWVNAMLTSEGVQGSMLAEVPEYQKKRSSFFRRLHERKYPETRIDAEVVLWVQK